MQIASVNLVAAQTAAVQMAGTSDQGTLVDPASAQDEEASFRAAPPTPPPLAAHVWAETKAPVVVKPGGGETGQIQIQIRDLVTARSGGLLQVLYSSSKGRHRAAAESGSQLAAGTDVLREPPAAFVLTKAQRLARCGGCGARQDLASAVPCKGCPMVGAGLTLGGEGLWRPPGPCLGWPLQGTPNGKWVRLAACHPPSGLGFRTVR